MILSQLIGVESSVSSRAISEDNCVRASPLQYPALRQSASYS